MRFQPYHVGISVADLDAMAAWYADTLGFTADGSFEVEQAGLHGSLLSRACGLGLELLERAGSEVVGDYYDALTAALTRGYGHIALSAEDSDKSFEHLISASGPVPGSSLRCGKGERDRG